MGWKKMLPPPRNSSVNFTSPASTDFESAATNFFTPYALCTEGRAKASRECGPAESKSQQKNPLFFQKLFFKKPMLKPSATTISYLGSDQQVRVKPTSLWRWPSPTSKQTKSTASFLPVQPSKQAKLSAFSQGIYRKKYFPTFAPYTMPCTICSTWKRSKNSWTRESSKSLPSPICAAAP